MNKGLVCSILLGLLLLLVTILQINIDGFLIKLDEKAEILDNKLTLYSSNLSNSNILGSFDDLQAFWEENISTICLMIDYNIIAPLGESISRLGAGIETQDYNSCCMETKQLLQMIGALKKIFSVRLPNIL